MEPTRLHYATPTDAAQAQDKAALDEFELDYLTQGGSHPYRLTGHVELPLDNNPRATGFVFIHRHGRCIIWENVDQCLFCGGSGEAQRPGLGGKLIMARCPYCRGVGDFALEKGEPTLLLTNDDGLILAAGDDLHILIEQAEHSSS